MGLNEAVSKFVETMNKVHTDLIFNKNTETNDITMPKAGNRVTVVRNSKYEHGYVTKIDITKEKDLMYVIKLENDTPVHMLYEDNIFLYTSPEKPMYNYLYSMPSYLGNNWLKNPYNRKIASDCGFNVYLTDYGYFLGINGFGYNFKEIHWKPFYLAVGLNWHKPEVQDKAGQLVEILERKRKQKSDMITNLNKEIKEKQRILIMKDDVLSHRDYKKLKAEVSELRERVKKLENQMKVYDFEIVPVLKNLNII